MLLICLQMYGIPIFTKRFKKCSMIPSDMVQVLSCYGELEYSLSCKAVQGWSGGMLVN